MKRLALLILLIVLVALASACNFFTQPADLQTENLEIEIAGTEIAAVRQTATANADRLAITLEYAQTAVGNVDQQSTRIAATLVAGGMAIVDASAITAVAPTEAFENSGGLVNSPVPEISATPFVSGEGSARGSITIQEPPSPTPLATADSSRPRLASITLTEQVGADDCPIGSATSFSANAQDIYAAAVAYNLTPAHVVSSRWLLDGTEAAFYEWSPDFNIQEACIWFHLPASAVTFTPGNWSVELAIDGVSVGTPIAFTIASDSATELDMNETGS
jgi:hypothetical protein